MLQTGLLLSGADSIVSASDKPLPSFNHVKKPFRSADVDILEKQELGQTPSGDHSLLDIDRQSSESHASYFFGSSFNQQVASFRPFDRTIDAQLSESTSPSVEHFLANSTHHHNVAWSPFIVPLLNNPLSALPNAYSSARFNSPPGLPQQTDDRIHNKSLFTEHRKPASSESVNNSTRKEQGNETAFKQTSDCRSVYSKANNKTESLSIRSSHSVNPITDQLKANDRQSPIFQSAPDKVGSDKDSAESNDPPSSDVKSNNLHLGVSSKEAAPNQQVKRLERPSIALNAFSFGPPVRKRTDKPGLTGKLQSQFRVPRTGSSARSVARAKKAKKSKQQIAEDEDRKRRKANQQERDRMRKLNTALDMLRQELQKRCVFDLSSSLNSSVTLCLPEHRASKGAGSVSLLVSLKPEKFAWSSDSSESSEPSIPLNQTEESPNKAASQTSISSKTKKFSKIMTLRLACKYIKLLNSFLGR